eukprot:15361137-Ditylum_brightwellii.AAC.1
MVTTTSSNTAANSTRFDWQLPVQCCRHTTGPGLEQFHERANITSLLQSAGRVLQILPKTKVI